MTMNTNLKIINETDLLWKSIIYCIYVHIFTLFCVIFNNSKMATAPSPDSEVQFHTADNDSEIGQGDQFLDQSPLHKQNRPEHSPFPEPQRFLPRFDEIPPKR